MEEQPAPLVEKVPKKIGCYQIEGLMEKGGMSLLYMATHPETLDPIVIKVLSPQFIEQPEVVARFLHEAHIIALADHPNIVKLYEYGEWEKGLYIAMEFVRGTSLRKMLARQPFSLRRALEIILEISYALCHLHTHGVVHGDLKPENVLITDDKRVKIIDFGIAKMLFEANENKEESAQIIGTPIYMSPELQTHPGKSTVQSDIYSLGILAYELVIGKITHGKVILSQAPKGMQKILQKALQPQPEDRYQDIVDFISDLSNYMNSAEVEQDKPGPDYFFEMYEKLEDRHSLLLKKELPQWAEIGLVEQHAMGMQGLYYEFLQREGEPLFIAAECPSKGATGVLEAAMVRSFCRALLEEKLSKEEYIKKLFDLLHQDAFLASTHITLLFFDLENKSLHYEATEGTLLYKYSKGIFEKVGKEDSFQPGDRYLFTGFFLPEEQLESIAKESMQLEPEKGAEVLLRRLRLQALLQPSHPLLLVTLQF